MDGTTSIATPGMGTWLIILLLFLFLLGGNNGIGGFGNNNAGAFLAGAASQGPSATELLMNNNTMWQNQLMAQQNLANQTTLISTGFCNTNQNIDKVIYEGAKNTCAIIQNDNANTQKILDMMCGNTITQLRTDLAEAKLEANNASQTATLLAKLSPTPIPAYVVSSPYTGLIPAPSTEGTTA